MSGWRRRKERLGRRARAAATVAAGGAALASLGMVALDSSSASARAGRPRSVDLGAALAVARDGKVVVAGLSDRGSRDFALARYTQSGRLDRRFGTGGKVLTGFGARSFAGARAVAIRHGKIVVAGWAVVAPRTYSTLAAARYTGAGRLDRTFGRNGKVLTYFDSRDSSADAVAIQTDGRVVVAGSSRGSGFALARFTLRGTLDRSFGRGGKVLTDFGPRAFAYANALAIQPDGKIVVAGGVLKDREAFALARYNADGTLDRSFGNRGRVETKVGDYWAEAHGLVVQPDGKLVLAGNALVAGDSGFALVRYTADGELDPSFGREGTAFNGAGSVSALAIQRDRKLVTAGTGRGRYPKFSLARALQDGSPDGSFGRGRRLPTDFGTTARASAVVVRPDGKIVAAGTVGGRDFGLACYTSSGRLDRSFGRGGKVVTDFGSAWAIRGRRGG